MERQTASGAGPFSRSGGSGSDGKVRSTQPPLPAPAPAPPLHWQLQAGGVIAAEKSVRRISGVVHAAISSPPLHLKPDSEHLPLMIGGAAHGALIVCSSSLSASDGGTEEEVRRGPQIVAARRWGGRGVEFRLLGPVQARSGGRLVELGPPQHRLVLAVLALEVNRLVPAERLVELVWPVSQPRTANHGLQVCVSRLRRALARVEPPEDNTVELARDGSG